jgi:hypothetical protein
MVGDFILSQNTESLDQTQNVVGQMVGSVHRKEKCLEVLKKI